MNARTAIVPGLLALLAACGGGGVGASKFSGTVDTNVPGDTVKAGDTVPVTCLVTDRNGKVVATTTQVSVTEGAQGVTIQAGEIVFTVAGDYEVWCEAPGVKGKDGSPVTIHVEPGAPVQVIAQPDPATVPATIPSTVTCKVLDTYGNVCKNATVIDPLPDLDVADHVVSSKKAGTYPITCSVPDAPTVTKVPGDLVVKPADPARVAIIAEPNYKAYAVGDVVKVTFKVFDAFDNELTGIPGKLTPPQDAGIESTGPDQWKFKAEGPYEFKAALDAPFQDLTDTKVLVCDVGAPVLTILFPERGMTLTGDKVIKVRGTAVDAGGTVESVTVNGVKVEVGKDGSFEHPFTSVHGLNGLVITAADPYGHAARTTRGYYWSTAYVPVKKDTKAKDALIGEGAMVYLGQTALDDGDHDPKHLDDLATIVEVLLGGLDVTSLLSQIPIPPIQVPLSFQIPVVNATFNGNLEIGIKIKELRIGQPRVNLTCRDGGVAAGIAFDPLPGYADQKLSLALELTFTLHVGISVTNPADGQVYTLNLLDPSTTTGSRMGLSRFSISLSLDIDKQPGKDITVEGKDFQLELKNPSIDPLETLIIDLGTLDLFGQKIALGKYDLSQFVGNLSDLLSQYVLDPVLGFITQPLIDLLEPLVTTLIGDLIKQVVGLLALDTTFEIPPILGTQPIPLNIATNLSSVIFKADGGRIGLNAATMTGKGVDRDPLGSILRAGCGGTDTEPVLFEFQPTPEMQIGLRNDLVNEVLFSVWWSGLLSGTKIDASSLLSGAGGGALPIENLVITPNFLLPPILDDCEDRKEQIQVGDAYLDLTFTLLAQDVHLGVWLQLKGTGGVAAKGNEVGIRIEDINYFEKEIIDIGGNMGDLLSMVDGLIPMLLDQIKGQEFFFPIPAIDLGGVIPGIPAGTSIQLGNFAAFTSAGVTIVGGDLQ